MKKTIIKLVVFGLLMLSGGLLYSNFLDQNKEQQITIGNKYTKSIQNKSGLKDGDIVFQILEEGQGIAIQLATKSKYTHVGMIYSDKGQFYVLEAVQPVKITPLKKWKARGKNGHYVVKRLKNAEQILTPKTLAKMKQEGKKFVGKNYDLTFEWSDDRIYCSELVWKIYQRATGLEIGKLEKIRDFDLTSKEVKEKLQERYGNNIPMNETVISPVSVFNSELLITVESN